MSFLPDALEDFKSKQFWNAFFIKRSKLPFEWYCSYQTLQSYLNRISTSSRILIPGCGNSELSAEMYDVGYEEITNLDFSSLVIREMLTKNVRQRPKMKWMVMDVTKMRFQEAEFGAIVDKGALDALMGDLDTDGHGMKYLTEIRRVLMPEGVFFCISLLQRQVLNTLLSPLFFNFRIEIELIELDLESQVSELRPFIIIAEKLIDIDLEFPPLIHINRTSVDQLSNPSNQIQDILKIIDDENEMRRQGMKQGNWVSFSDFDLVHFGRRVSIGVMECHPLGERKPPLQFRVTLLDNSSHHDRTCAVYIVPKGKELNWLYSSIEGQWEISRQCNSTRLILSSISAKLTPLIPLSVRGVTNGTPILTSQEQEEISSIKRAAFESEISGRILVKDCLVEGIQLRRMVFGEAETLIQTEAPLIPNTDEEEESLLELPKDPTSVKVSFSSLSSEYHQFIAAVLKKKAMEDENHSMKVVLIGLGGGILPMHLHRTHELNLTVIELDPIVLEAAIAWFGFDSMIPVTIDDGVHKINELKGTEIDVLVIDAGGNDGTSAISCPPMDFLSHAFILAAANALASNGMMIVNFVTRSKEAFRSSVEVLKNQFPFLYSMKAKEDVNRVVIATKLPWSIEQENNDVSWKLEMDPDPRIPIKNITF
eukprot:g7683.t1